MAVNSWMLPPVVGYNTEVSHGAVNTLLASTLASLTANLYHNINPDCQIHTHIYMFIEKLNFNNTHIEMVETCCEMMPEEYDQPNRRIWCAFFRAEACWTQSFPGGYAGESLLLQVGKRCRAARNKTYIKL